MISDLAARTEALHPQQSFIVQAPAGSGKTGLLVYRMLVLLATVNQPQEILAITFTRKATAEMRERLLELFNKAEKKIAGKDGFEQQGIDLAWTVLQRDRELGWNLMDAPHQLQILTIDSFCSRLTSSMPWLSRLGDRPRTTDNAEPYYAAAVEQLFGELLQPDSRLRRALQTVMLELDYDYRRARQLFVSMLTTRDQWLRYILGNDLQRLRDHLEYAWQTVANEQLTMLGQLFSEQQLQTLVTLAKGAAGNIKKQEGIESPLAVFENFDQSIRFLGIEHWKALRFLLCTAGNKAKIREKVTILIGFVAKSREKNQFIDLLGEFHGDDDLVQALVAIDTIPALQFSDSDWAQLLALEEVLRALAGLLQLQFRAAGEVDHSEVAQRANLALQELDNPTDLALRMDYQLRHILVDEFQDTSHGQIELLKRLTAGWNQHDQAANTLFLVGDPMQSIYRFREADVSLFLRVANNAKTRVFDNIDIKTLVLSENFRSSSNLVDWYNNTFERGFPLRSDVLSGAIQYSPSTSNRAEGPVAVDCHWAADTNHEAELTVAAIKTALNNLPDDESQVALLVRGRSQLTALMPLLRREAIAYQGVDIRSLEQQVAVLDVIALCKAICREDDRVSWLSLLRGPWCGLTLVELQQCVSEWQDEWKAEQDRTVWQQLHGQDWSKQPRLKRFVDIMRDVLMQRQQVGLSDLVRWAWKKLGGEYTLMNTEYQDIETVFDLIQGLEKGGDLPSVTELDQAVSTLYAEPSTKQQHRLVISTMHKAKGLQYHTVILPSLGNAPGANNKDMMMWSEYQSQQGEQQLLLAPLRLDNSQQHYEYLRELDRKRSANEAARLMYVACTRAEKKLVFLGKVNVDEDKAELKKPASNTLLSTIWDSVADSFTNSYQNNASVSFAEQQFELDQTLLRIPSDFKAESAQSIDWDVTSQLNASDLDQQAPPMLFEWSTEVAQAVGMVVHEWLQFNQSQLFEIELNETLKAQWRSDLLALQVPAARVNYGVQRISQAIENIQQDQHAQFIFKQYSEQRNEMALASNEGGVVKTYRIDRTFVDDNDVRWIVDYKTTFTRNDDVTSFVDEQVATRHKKQLEKYGQLLSEMDDRNIKLAVYFPMLKQIRSWDFVG